MFHYIKNIGQRSVGSKFRSARLSALILLMLVTGLLSACGTASENTGAAQEEATGNGDFNPGFNRDGCAGRANGRDDG